MLTHEGWLYYTYGPSNHFRRKWFIFHRDTITEFTRSIPSFTQQNSSSSSGSSDHASNSGSNYHTQLLKSSERTIMIKDIVRMEIIRPSQPPYSSLTFVDTATAVAASVTAATNDSASAHSSVVHALHGFRLVVSGVSALAVAGGTSGSGISRRASILTPRSSTRGQSLSANGQCTLDLYTENEEQAWEWIITLRYVMDRAVFEKEARRRRGTRLWDPDEGRSNDRKAHNRSTSSLYGNASATMPHSLSRRHSMMLTRQPKKTMSFAEQIENQMHPLLVREISMAINHHISTLAAAIAGSPAVAASRLERKKTSILMSSPIQWIQLEYEKAETRKERLKTQLQILENRLQDNMKFVQRDNVEWIEGGDDNDISHTQGDIPSQSPRTEHTAVDAADSVLYESENNAEPPTPNDIRIQKHHLIELLLLFTQNQVRMCSLRLQLMQKIVGKLTVDLFDDVVAKNRGGVLQSSESSAHTHPSHDHDLHFAESYKEFTKVLEKQLMRDKEYAESRQTLSTFEAEINVSALALTVLFKSDCATMIDKYGAAVTELRDMQKKIKTRLADILQQQHNNQPTDDGMIHSFEREVGELQLQIMGKKISILLLKQDLLRDKVSLFEDDNGRIQYSVKKSSHIFSPLKQHVHYLYITRTDRLRLFDEEFQEPAQIWLLALMFTKLVLQRQLLMEHNLRQYIARLSQRSSKYMRRLKHIVCEQNDIDIERQRIQKQVEQRRASANENDGNDMESLQEDLISLSLTLDLISHKTDILSVKLERVNREIIDAKNLEQKCIAERVALYQDSGNCCRLASFFDNQSVEQLELLSAEMIFWESCEADRFFHEPWEHLFAEFMQRTRSDETILTHEHIIEEIHDSLEKIHGITSSGDSPRTKDMRKLVQPRKTLLRQLLSDVITNREINSYALQEISLFISSITQSPSDLFFTISGYGSQNPDDDDDYVDEEHFAYTVANVPYFLHHLTSIIRKERPDFAAELMDNEIYGIAEWVLFMHQNGVVYSQCLALSMDPESDRTFLINCRNYRNQLVRQLMQSDAMKSDQSEPGESNDDTFHTMIDTLRREYSTVIWMLQSIIVTRSPTAKLIIITRAAKLTMRIMGDSMSNSNRENRNTDRSISHKDRDSETRKQKENEVQDQEQQQQETSVVGSDDFLPLFICLVSLSSVENMISQLNFLKNFAHEELPAASEYAYFLSSLEAAVYYILQFNTEAEAASMDSS